MAMSAKERAEKLKAFNAKYTADFMKDYCIKHNKKEWWNNILKETKVNSKGNTVPLTIAEIRSRFVRDFFPEEITSKKASNWRTEI